MKYDMEYNIPIDAIRENGEITDYDIPINAIRENGERRYELIVSQQGIHSLCGGTTLRAEVPAGAALPRCKAFYIKMDLTSDSQGFVPYKDGFLLGVGIPAKPIDNFEHYKENRTLHLALEERFRKEFVIQSKTEGTTARISICADIPASANGKKAAKTSAKGAAA